ncbi:MAG: AI-2E family transporter [Anaerolineaceae bacterium]|nr:AI-2E family transporter [Anaerolineaceae bacterium]
MDSQPKEAIPQWNNTTKLIVALVLVVLVGFLIWKFQFILGPLLFAIILAYLLYPVAGFLHKKVHLPWRAAATILYLLIFLILIGLLTWGGISLVEPLQNLVTFLQKLVTDLPKTIADLTSQAWMIGPFRINLSNLSATQLWTDLQGILSPALSSIGTLLGNIASGAVSTITWTAFTLLVSYFFSVESRGTRSNLIKFTIPRYEYDFEMMKVYLSNIWGAFLRGQLVIFVLTYFIYAILLAALGERYFLALAVLAGLARFVPYVGPFVAWTTYGLVALFQGTTIFGLLPFPYALIIVGSAIVVDVIMDNFVSPRIMSSALSVHPAAVLVMVIVSAKLIGFIGVLVAAPVLASLKLFLHYISRKMTDLDPWEDMALPVPPPPIKDTLRERWQELSKRISGWFLKRRAARMKKTKE